MRGNRSRRGPSSDAAERDIRCGLYHRYLGRAHMLVRFRDGSEKPARMRTRRIPRTLGDRGLFIHEAVVEKAPTALRPPWAPV